MKSNSSVFKANFSFIKKCSQLRLSEKDEECKDETTRSIPLKLNSSYLMSQNREAYNPKKMKPNHLWKVPKKLLALDNCFEESLKNYFIENNFNYVGYGFLPSDNDENKG